MAFLCSFISQIFPESVLGTTGVAVGFCGDWHRWDLAFTELTEKRRVLWAHVTASLKKGLCPETKN